MSTNETANTSLQKVTLYVSKNLHSLMKEYAKRKRLHLGAAYDQAMHLFLAQTKNFMGSKRSQQLKKG